ncbi:MAG: metalloregulator ArsR/SmtB family transcription factor [archaeon]
MINKSILKTCCDEGYEKKELYGAYKIFFGTLVSEPRLKIINILRKKSMNVSEIMKGTGGEQTAVSHDLQRLRNCGFVESEIRGKFRYYKLNKMTIKPLMDLIDKHMAGNCIHILRSRKSKEVKNEK